MSEYRYFRAGDGRIESVDPDFDREGYIPFYERNHLWSEVKVAPLDAIVIKRDELPGVRTEPTKGVPTVRAGEWSFDHHTDDVPTVESAKAYLAAALWFEKNPPKPEVDEAQISALYNAIQEVEEEFGYSVPDLARFLYHKGVRVEASDG